MGMNFKDIKDFHFNKKKQETFRNLEVLKED